MSRRVLSVLLALALVLAMALPAAAANPKKGKPFADVESHWAKRQIALLKGAGVLKGVGEDLFAPEAQMVRAEIAVMLLRALGLEHEVGQYGEDPEDPSPFADLKSAPVWSRNHIRLCYEHRLMLGEVKGDGRVCNPNKPITRQEFVVLLVRTMDEDDPRDLEDLAAELIDDAAMLPFRDRNAIAPWAVGYILLALQEGWLEGYADNTFQPNKPVSRAEAACFMERLEAHLGWRWSARYVGTIVEVDTTANTITILTEDDEDEEQPGEELTFELGDECLIYIGKEAADLADLEPEWEVKVFVQEDLAVFIRAERPDEDDEDEEPEVEIEGEIAMIDAKDPFLVVEYDDESLILVETTDDTVIEVDGDPAEFEDLEVGMAVEVRGLMEGAKLVASEVLATTP